LVVRSLHELEEAIMGKTDPITNILLVVFIAAVACLVCGIVYFTSQSQEELMFPAFNSHSDEVKLDWFESTVAELRIILHSDITVKQSSLDALEGHHVPQGELYQVLQKQVDELKSKYNSLVAQFNYRKQFVTWEDLTDEMKNRFDNLPVRYKPI
jgi:hypothetical protein